MGLNQVCSRLFSNYSTMATRPSHAVILRPKLCLYFPFYLEAKEETEEGEEEGGEGEGEEGEEEEEADEGDKKEEEDEQEKSSGEETPKQQKKD